MLEYQKGVATRYASPTPEKHGPGRQEAMRLLRKFFARPAPNLNIVYFSGHGFPGCAGADDTRGALCIGPVLDLSDRTISELRAETTRRGVPLNGHRSYRKTYIDALQREEMLTLDDVLELWTAARSGEPPTAGSEEPRLLLVCDACYSGKLVAALRARPSAEQQLLRVGIQSAGNARQTVGQGGEDFTFTHNGQRYDYNGCLTAYLTAKQEEGSRVRWTQLWQHPQFYCTWDPRAHDRASVDLDLGNGHTLRTINRPSNR